MPAPHQPTDETREAVAVLIGAGTRVEVVAKAIGVDARTLRKHYKAEIADGKEIANAAVAQTLYRMARSGRVPAATFFWLKCRAGWREVEGTTPIERAEEAVRESLADRLANISVAE